MQIITGMRVEGGKGGKNMKYELLFTRLDGVTDWAILTTRKIKGYYATSIKIGTISRQVNSGMINKLDSHHAAVQVLSFYRDNTVI